MKKNGEKHGKSTIVGLENQSLHNYKRIVMSISMSLLRMVFCYQEVF